MRLGMLIDLDKCSACQACTISCCSENNLPKGIERTKVYPVGPKGTYPHISMQLIPIGCMQCDNPPCVTVCPIKATYKREDGIIVQDNKKCMGCKYCMNACPYEARTFNKYTPFTEEYDKVPAFINPNSTVSPRHTIDKCDFCIHRIDEGNYTPACIRACPSNARYFGDLDDPNSEINKLIKERHAQFLRPEKNTKPKVYYVWDK